MKKIESTNWMLALCALAMTACAAEVGEGREIGALDMPLTSVATDGTPFFLAGTFDLVGPEPDQVTVAQGDPEFGDDNLVLTPRVGEYALTLTNWTLYDGSASPVAPVTNATLLNPTQNLTIVNNGTTDAIFQFLVPGSGTVIFARGTLNVDFAVDVGLPDGSACMIAEECDSFVCQSGTCQTATCFDGVQNGDETSPDMGGTCAGAMGNSCDPMLATSCPASEECIADTNGNYSCQPLMGNTCDPNLATSCPIDEQCIAVNGNYSCVPVTTSSCDPNLATTCPASEECVADSNGVYSCQPLMANSCDPNLATSCPASEECVADSNGNYSCQPISGSGNLGDPCDPMLSTSCNSPLVCTPDSVSNYTCQ